MIPFMCNPNFLMWYYSHVARRRYCMPIVGAWLEVYKWEGL